MPSLFHGHRHGHRHGQQGVHGHQHKMQKLVIRHSLQIKLSDLEASPWAMHMWQCQGYSKIQVFVQRLTHSTSVHRVPFMELLPDLKTQPSRLTCTSPCKLADLEASPWAMHMWQWQGYSKISRSSCKDSPTKCLSIQFHSWNCCQIRKTQQSRYRYRSHYHSTPSRCSPRPP